MKRAIARGWRGTTVRQRQALSVNTARLKAAFIFPALCPSSATPEVLPLKFPPSPLKRFLQSHSQPDDAIEHLRGFSRRPVLSSEDQLGSFKLSSKKTSGFDVARRSAREPRKKGDKQGRAFLQKEMQTMVGRLATCSICLSHTAFLSLSSSL